MGENNVPYILLLVFLSAVLLSLLVLRSSRGAKRKSADLDSAELIERIVAMAKKDPKLAQKLRELKAIDDMYTGFISGEEVKFALKTQEETIPRAMKLTREIAVAVSKPGENVEEIETWLSYYAKRIVANLPISRSPN